MTRPHDAAGRAGRVWANNQPGQLPLAGLKVVDLTLARAGPTAVRHLADWGATVIHTGIAEIIRTRPTQAWIDVFNAVGVTCGPIYITEEAFGDPQIRHLGVAVPVRHPVLGPLEVAGSLLNFDSTPRQVRRPTPDSGADTADILRELGYGGKRLAGMKAKDIC